MPHYRTILSNEEPQMFFPKQLKTDANLFMKAIVIASSFVIEGDYKERYGTCTNLQF